jgi:hypothetical protein
MLMNLRKNIIIDSFKRVPMFSIGTDELYVKIPTLVNLEKYVLNSLLSLQFKVNEKKYWVHIYEQGGKIVCGNKLTIYFIPEKQYSFMKMVAKIKEEKQKGGEMTEEMERLLLLEAGVDMGKEKERYKGEVGLFGIRIKKEAVG